MILSHVTGEKGTNQVPDAPENKGNEALRCCPGSLARFFIDVELSCDEEKIVACAVEKNSCKDQGSH